MDQYQSICVNEIATVHFCQCCINTVLNFYLKPVEMNLQSVLKVCVCGGGGGLCLLC